MVKASFRHLLGALVLVSACSLSSCRERTVPVEPRQRPLVEEQTEREEPARPELQPIILEPEEERDPNMLQADGTRIVNGKGEQVILRGCNLGNWLLLEMWMLDWSHIRDQHHLETIIAERFGEDEKERLFDIYRDHWITERDFRVIRRFGMNCVRVPFNYRILMAEDKPYELKSDAFKWLDQSIEWARGGYGLYVILDLHGTPGGQSVDHTTGRGGQNRLWEEEYQKQTAWLWQQIAEHYKDSPVVAAYDVINEPFGDYKSADHIPKLIETCERIYASIREVDPHHIIFMPGSKSSEIYGKPEDHDWENVGYTEHFYPGLFGEEPTTYNHARFVYRTIPRKAAFLEEVQVPFLVGEFNVVFQHVGGAALMRAYYDTFAEHGWAATMWCYKLVHKRGGVGVDNWYMVTNKDPLPRVNPETSSKEEIEAYFKSFSTMEYGYYENLGAALTMDTPPEVQLPALPVLPVVPPATDDPSPWSASDIDGAMTGGQKVISEKELEIYGSGEDIWAKSDQFRYLWQKISGDVYLGATLDSLVDSHIHAKAGLMLRGGLEPDAAFVMIHVFPDGELMLAIREEPGAEVTQKTIGRVQVPIRMRLVRKGPQLEAAFVENGGQWTPERVRLPLALRFGGYVGFAVMSHDNQALTTARFSDIRFSAR